MNTDTEKEIETCAICLDDMSDQDDIYTLSCDHKFHHKCFKGLVFKTTHVFVDCPLCRSMNVTRPIDSELSDKENLERWFHRDKRCIEMTSKGKRCKNLSVFMNNGCCRTHCKEVLPESKYQIYADYLGYVLETTNHWNTKVYMLDISRKLLKQYEDITSVQDIQHYFLEFFHKCRYEKMSYENQSNPKIMYQYYGLKFPSKEWSQKGIHQRVLI